MKKGKEENIKDDRKNIVLSENIVYQESDIHAKSLRDYKFAVYAALDNNHPDRSFLYNLYNNLLLDNHVASCIESRILYSQHSKFKIVDDKGNENEELTWLFERPFYESLIELILKYKFQGTTLIELFQLNKNLELDEVVEIPQSHFIPRKGLIIKEVGELKGWSYKEGLFSQYYLQIGKDRDLGMLERLAPMILAKKLGFGAWQDYIDKFGVPSLFITTDREDRERMNELYQIGLNFKRNSFAVGRGNEKFEISDSHQGNAKDTFDVFIERINNEISKRILGGSSITDEKSFVGSTEIQYKLTEDRYNADKLFIKNIMNKNIFPHLTNLSPVYSKLENHYFQWNNTQIKTAEETADLISKLAPHFEIDPEFVEQETGIKITGIKNNFTPFDNVIQQEKKK